MTKTPSILIVEDDEWLAEQYVRTLQAESLRADVVPHALAAMDVLDTAHFDALVLDVLLPGPNALVLLHELQSHADLASIPVILCTNSSEQLAKEDMAAYGVKYILDKATMTPGDLVATVKKVLP